MKKKTIQKEMYFQVSQVDIIRIVLTMLLCRKEKHIAFQIRKTVANKVSQGI